LRMGLLTGWGVVASPTGSSGSAESTGSIEPGKTPNTIVSGVSGLEPIGNTLGLLGIVLFGALLL